MIVAGMGVNDVVEDVAFDEPEREMGPIELNAARQEQSQHIDQVLMHEQVPEEECWGEMGKSPIGARWVDIVNNSDGETFIRSRLVARDLREKGDNRAELFVATPPLDTLQSTKIARMRLCCQLIAAHRPDVTCGRGLARSGTFGRDVCADRDIS